jgi:hypothetical protein
MINGIASPRPFKTCSAVVGETWFDGFALGAARGNPQARMTARMKGWLGQRMPTVSPPAVTTSGISCERGNTSVNGPGQNAAPSFSAWLDHLATQRRAMATLATCTMMGL